MQAVQPVSPCCLAILAPKDQTQVCARCLSSYPIRLGIPALMLQEARRHCTACGDVHPVQFDFDNRRASAVNCDGCKQLFPIQDES